MSYDAYILALYERRPRAKTGKCRYCGTDLNWSTQRHQYGRAISYGLSPQQAKQFGPACGKCTTKHLSPRRQQRKREIETARAAAAATADPDDGTGRF
jgi:hypothetical protein